MKILGLGHHPIRQRPRMVLIVTSTIDIIQVRILCSLEVEVEGREGGKGEF